MFHLRTPLRNKVQTEFEIDGVGVSVPKIPAIEKALKAYIPHKNARCEAQTHEKAAKHVLLAAFHENAGDLPKDKAGALCYKHGDKIYRLEPGKEKLRVDDAEGDEGDD